MEQPLTTEPILSKPKLSYWRRLGGGSLTISIVVHAILLVIALYWIFAVIPPPPEKVVDFKPSGGGGNPNANKNQQKKQSQMVKTNVSRVAAKDAVSNFTLPDPEMNSSMSKLGALGAGGMQGLGGSGSGGGQGSGIGTGFGSGMGDGMAKGAPPVFFGLEMRAQRVAYVIDLSISMRADGRDILMKEELTRSVKALPDKTKFAVIFFSGPVWVPGDEVVNNVVKHKGKEYKWSSKSSWEWTSEKPYMKVDWLDAGDTEKKKMVSLIKNQELIGGTDWEAPLEIAINMEPPPEQIFFMTDGAMENRDMDRLVRGLVAKAKAKNVKINTVNMMVPQKEAIDAMDDLASKTGGKFTIVEKGGKVRKGSKSDR
ncbi:MAG: VWA domain-containing protein [Akkermansiaceae bacterium]|nr:VWA domain-containing protein [Akkermansiaceae bacterium]